MNQVQNTSLFISEQKIEGKDQRWLELASAGHSPADGIGVYGREYDPYDLSWAGHLMDNPLLRQAIKETPLTRNATLDSKLDP
jgi:hypothetical protein